MAQDGEEALQSFRQLRPDLVLLDIHLPKVDGVDVLRMIRNDSEVPVIMVTALADDVDKLLALRLGADDYVVKPFNPLRWLPESGPYCAAPRPSLQRLRRRFGSGPSRSMWKPITQPCMTAQGTPRRWPSP